MIARFFLLACLVFDRSVRADTAYQCVWDMTKTGVTKTLYNHGDKAAIVTWEAWVASYKVFRNQFALERYNKCQCSQDPSNKGAGGPGYHSDLLGAPFSCKPKLTCGELLNLAYGHGFYFLPVERDLDDTSGLIKALPFITTSDPGAKKSDGLLGKISFLDLHHYFHVAEVSWRTGNVTAGQIAGEANEFWQWLYWLDGNGLEDGASAYCHEDRPSNNNGAVFGHLLNGRFGSDSCFEVALDDSSYPDRLKTDLPDKMIDTVDPLMKNWYSPVDPAVLKQAKTFDDDPAWRCWDTIFVNWEAKKYCKLRGKKSTCPPYVGSGTESGCYLKYSTAYSFLGLWDAETFYFNAAANACSNGTSMDGTTIPMELPTKEQALKEFPKLGLGWADANDCIWTSTPLEGAPPHDRHAYYSALQYQSNPLFGVAGDKTKCHVLCRRKDCTFENPNGAVCRK